MPRLATATVLAPALIAAMLLGGCSEKPVFAPACPQLSLLAEGADLTRFAGAGRDVTDRVLDARIVGVDASCEPGRRRGEVVAQLRVRTALTRGPAASGRTAQVPYFVAVMDGETVVDRRAFTLQGEFPANVDIVQVAGDELELRFPASAGQEASRYRIYVSLQLTPEELEYNRRVALR